MGNESSAQKDHFEKPYVPLNATRLHGDDTTTQQIYTRSKTKIINSGFSGIWSRYTPNSSCPEPRSNHFACFSAELRKIFIGYGYSEEKGFLDDVWSLSIDDLKWEHLYLNGDKISPRSGSKSFFKNGKIYIFGGRYDNEYYSDLHSIDILTGTVEVIETENDIAPRASPLFFEYQNNFYVWGGFNGDWPNELNILDTSKMKWTSLETNIVGRAAMPYITYKDKVYAYGGTNNGCFIVINPATKFVEELPSKGSSPTSSITNAGMVVVDHYALLFGGKAAKPYSLLFACDLEKLIWFPFNVKPDENTLSINDGMINEIGLFLMPRVHSNTFLYDDSTKTIISFFGTPEENPPSIFTISIAEAMSVIHLRDDLLDTLHSY